MVQIRGDKRHCALNFWTCSSDDIKRGDPNNQTLLPYSQFFSSLYRKKSFLGDNEKFCLLVCILVTSWLFPFKYGCREKAKKAMAEVMLHWQIRGGPASGSISFQRIRQVVLDEFQKLLNGTQEIR